jgi:hypothetical protein
MQKEGDRIKMALETVAGLIEKLAKTDEYDD